MSHGTTTRNTHADSALVTGYGMALVSFSQLDSCWKDCDCIILTMMTTTRNVKIEQTEKQVLCNLLLMGKCLTAGDQEWRYGGANTYLFHQPQSQQLKPETLFA